MESVSDIMDDVEARLKALGCDTFLFVLSNPYDQTYTYSIGQNEMATHGLMLEVFMRSMSRRMLMWNRSEDAKEDDEGEEWRKNDEN